MFTRHRSPLLGLMLLGAGCVSKSTIVDPAGDAGPVVGSALCMRGGDCSEVAKGPVENLDLLFVIDNSGSMREEQKAVSAAPVAVRPSAAIGGEGAGGSRDLRRTAARRAAG